VHTYINSFAKGHDLLLLYAGLFLQKETQERKKERKKEKRKKERKKERKTQS